MSRVERVESLLRQIEDETRMAFDEHTQLYHKTQSLESENAKLRKAARDAWLLFVRFGAVHPYNLPEVDRVRESLEELEIEVKDDD